MMWHNMTSSHFHAVDMVQGTIKTFDIVDDQTAYSLCFTFSRLDHALQIVRFESLSSGMRWHALTRLQGVFDQADRLFSRLLVVTGSSAANAHNELQGATEEHQQVLSWHPRRGETNLLFTEGSRDRV
eukprot:768650-Hanusia_phi.AAC.8